MEPVQILDWLHGLGLMLLLLLHLLTTRKNEMLFMRIILLTMVTMLKDVEL